MKRQYKRRFGFAIVPARRIHNARQHRAAEYQWNKAESFEEYTQRCESGA